jgi:hypothetical protein
MNRPYKISMWGNCNWDGDFWDEVVDLTSIEAQQVRQNLRKLLRGGAIQGFSVKFHDKIVGVDETLKVVVKSFGPKSRITFPKGFPNVEG